MESQRAEAMRLHQKHRELGASHFGLANAMGSYMQNLEEAVRPSLPASAWLEAGCCVLLAKDWSSDRRPAQCLYHLLGPIWAVPYACCACTVAG